MSADAAAHRARRWRVHGLAPDFALLDFWEVALAAEPAGGATFAEFLRVFATTGATSAPVYALRPRSVADVLHLARLGAAGGLFALRGLLGRLFGLDADDGTRAIPGCRETRVRARLTDADRARHRAVLPSRWSGAFETVYAFADEALLEIANPTIHALLHLSWIPTADGRPRAGLAVYVKSRGLGSRVYLALIAPFRHAVVYPAWIEHLARTWAASRTPEPWGDTTIVW